LEDLLRIAFENRFPRIEVDPAVVHHLLPLHPLGLLEARKRIADRRAGRDEGNRGVDVRGCRQRYRVVARIAWTHPQQLGDMTAAGTAIDADPAWVALPSSSFRLEPAHAVIRVLHRSRIRRFPRKPKI